MRMQNPCARVCILFIRFLLFFTETLLGHFVTGVSFSADATTSGRIYHLTLFRLWRGDDTCFLSQVWVIIWWRRGMNSYVGRRFAPKTVSLHMRFELTTVNHDLPTKTATMWIWQIIIIYKFIYKYLLVQLKYINAFRQNLQNLSRRNIFNSKIKLWHKSIVISFSGDIYFLLL